MVLHDLTVPCYHSAATLVAIDPASYPGVVLKGAATLNVSVFPPSLPVPAGVFPFAARDALEDVADLCTGRTCVLS